MVFFKPHLKETNTKWTTSTSIILSSSLSISSLAPCAPTVLNVRMQKIGQTHWAMASWDSVNCSDVEYLVEITGRIQNSPQTLMEVSSYWLLTTYYELPMPCSTVYNLTVRSRNSAGVSEPSSAFSGVTGNFTVKLSLGLYSFFTNTLGGCSNLVQTSTWTQMYQLDFGFQKPR